MYNPSPDGPASEKYPSEPASLTCAGTVFVKVIVGVRRGFCHVTDLEFCCCCWLLSLFRCGRLEVVTDLLWCLLLTPGLGWVNAVIQVPPSPPPSASSSPPAARLSPWLVAVTVPRDTNGAATGEGSSSRRLNDVHALSLASLSPGEVGWDCVRSPRLCLIGNPGCQPPTPSKSRF